MQFKCIICGKVVPDWDEASLLCCDGYMCNCQGLPAAAPYHYNCMEVAARNYFRYKEMWE